MNVTQDNNNLFNTSTTAVDMLNQMSLFNPNTNDFVGIIGNKNSSLVHAFTQFGSNLALSGNLWELFVAYFVATDENPYSLHCEYNQKINKSIQEIAYYDCKILFDLFNSPLSKISDSLNKNVCDLLSNFDNKGTKSKNVILSEYITALAMELSVSRNAKEFQSVIQNFYSKKGVGNIAVHKAFKIDDSNSSGANLVPITNTDPKRFGDIVGYEFQKEKVCANTQAFLDNKTANNVLLYGDGGTGKSSTIKALINEYFEQGLRIIEVYKHQFKSLLDIISKLKHRNYKFIIYLDDLSFEDFEIDYKYFKAIIEGGIEVKPNNVLIYATSNRRHIIKENFSDRYDINPMDELHRSDTIQEKLSLSARFGLSLLYLAPNQVEFLEIVNQLATKHNISMDKDTLQAQALAWSMRNSGKSGRAAQQFINTLI